MTSWLWYLTTFIARRKKKHPRCLHSGLLIGFNSDAVYIYGPFVADNIIFFLTTAEGWLQFIHLSHLSQAVIILKYPSLFQVFHTLETKRHRIIFHSLCWTRLVRGYPPYLSESSIIPHHWLLSFYISAYILYLSSYFVFYICKAIQVSTLYLELHQTAHWFAEANRFCLGTWLLLSGTIV